MRRLRVEVPARDTLVATRVGLANRWWQRARGYLGRPEPAPGEGILLSPCSAVHMLGLRYPLDVILIDRDRRVVALYPGLAPGRRTAWHRDARFTLELRNGSIAAAGIATGDVLDWRETDAAAPDAGPVPSSRTSSEVSA